MTERWSPRPAPAEAVTEKLHKALARAGLGSRRRIEEWIGQGRVTVNGETARIGARIGPGDRVAVDGRPVETAAAPPARVLVYHKPLGELVTRDDPGGRPTVFDSLPPLASGRWVAVGRLDINTSGLLLLTNDGDLANRLMHPSADLDREYVVRVQGDIDDSDLEHLVSGGIELDGRPAAFRSIRTVGKRSGRNRTFRVTLTEGRNREVRRLWEAVGGTVNRLKRIRFGPVDLPRDLPPGAWREIPVNELGPIRG